MSPVPFTAWACPLDGSPLIRREKSLYCARNHCFDLDRKGAVNLLPVQFKKSKAPGDSKDMVAARTRFLENGFYQRIAEALCDVIEEINTDPLTVFDAGCGEGYYTQFVAAHLEKMKHSFSIAGMDISKDAIAAASARSKDIQWIVGTNAAIPVSDGAVDCVLSLFGFPVWSEFKRILKPNGILIAVDPAPDHLIELRRILYPVVTTKEKDASDAKGFVLQTEKRLAAAFGPLVEENVADLLWMTPHAFRAKPEDRAQAAASSFEAMTLDVSLRVYRC